MIKLRVKVFLLAWAYYWVSFFDAAIGIVTLGTVDLDWAGIYVVASWSKAAWLLEDSRETWDDPDDPSEEWIHY